MSNEPHSLPAPSNAGGSNPRRTGAEIDILYHHRTRASDGQSVHIDELVKALEEQGANVRMVGPRRVDAMSESRGRQILPKPVYELLELAYSGVELLKLAKAIRKKRPDAIYERANVYTLSGVWAARLFCLPLILEVNAPLAEERAKFGGLALPGIARWSEELVWRSADYVLPVTRVLGDLIESAGVSPSRISSDLQRDRCPEVFRSAKTRPVAVARLIPEGTDTRICGVCARLAWIAPDRPVVGSRPAAFGSQSAGGG